MRWGSTVGVALVPAACGAFDAAPAPSDAGTPTPDATTSDASTSDASADAAGTFCERQPQSLFLCEDFASGLAFNWSEKAEWNDGHVELDAGTFTARGGPDASGQSWAYLVKDLGTDTNEVIVSFSMR